MSPILRPIKGAVKNIHEAVNAASIEPSSEVLTSLSEETVTKDEKISSVLQEILERKIDKAIEGAEATLATTQPEIIPVEAPVEVVVTPQVVSVQPVVNTAGQEIHIPTPAEEIHPSLDVVTNAVTLPEVEVLPTVQTVNVIPINVVSSEVTTMPNIPPQAITTETVEAVPALPPKIHWFDKLFGSGPKSA
jgi:hypothetical protein